MRSRPLSGDERRLWAEFARSIRPLSGRIVPAAPSPAGDSPPVRPPTSPTPAVPPAKPAAVPPLAPLDRLVSRALARGRAFPDATLDLHGMTQAEAHARLMGFLRRAQASGSSLVLVITGRGRTGDGDGRGVLRRIVPLWLGLPELRSVVLGFAEAGPRQGGAGAIYVRLRRKRAPG